MIKRLFLGLIIFSLFGCSESQDDKFISYCMDSFNKYSANSVTTTQCSCLYQEAKQQLSESVIDQIIKEPLDLDKPILSEAQREFILLGHTSTCFN